MAAHLSLGGMASRQGRRNVLAPGAGRSPAWLTPLGFVSPGVGLMALAFVAPLAIILLTSLHAQGGVFSAVAYIGLFKSILFARVAWITVQVSLAVSFLAVLMGYPIALHLSMQKPKARRLLMILVLVPFWTSVLVKSYAFIILFGKHGLLNDALAAISPSLQLDLLFNRAGMVIAMAHQMIPFVVLPLLANLLDIDRNLYRAASVIGAGAWTTFMRVTLPLSMPGLAAGFMLSFMLSLGAYVTPALLGSRKDMMLANLIEFRLKELNDWAGASAIAIVILLACAVLLACTRLIRRLRANS